MKMENVSHEISKHIPNGQMWRRLIGQTEKPVEVRVRELTFMNNSFDHPVKQGLITIQTNLLFTQKRFGTHGQFPMMAPRLNSLQ